MFTAKGDNPRDTLMRCMSKTPYCWYHPGLHLLYLQVQSRIYIKIHAATWIVCDAKLIQMGHLVKYQGLVGQGINEKWDGTESSSFSKPNKSALFRLGGSMEWTLKWRQIKWRQCMHPKKSPNWKGRETSKRNDFYPAMTSWRHRKTL